MTGQSGRERDVTREIIEGLFVHPPVNEAELVQRLKPVDLPAAREFVVDRLHGSKLPEQDGPLFLALLGHTGIGHQKQRLTSIALDDDRDSKERLWASMALTSEDPDAMDVLVGEMGPEGMGSLAELSLFELLTMQGKDEVGLSIATALEALVDERPATDLLARIESVRMSIGASCALAYEESLRREALSFVRSHLLDLFIDEASQEGIDLLERLRDESAQTPAGRQYQSALLRLRSKLIEPRNRRTPASGYALVSNCDGQGGFVLLGVFDIADGTHSVSDVCIRAGGDVRDGFIYPRRLSNEVDGFVERAKQQLGCHFVRVDLAEAAALVSRGVQRTHDMGLEVPTEARQAVGLFDGLVGRYRWGEKPCCAPRTLFTRDEVDRLLSRPEYDDTWFLDAADLSSLDKPDTEVLDDPERHQDWLDEAVAKLDAEVLRHRVASMAQHMAHWHVWNDEPQLAALCMGMAKEVGERFEDSHVIRVLLDRSILALEYPQSELAYHYGDPTERQHLKRLFFQQVQAPTGRDLAVLDMTEAASAALASVFDQLSPEHRPREDERDLAAYSIGRIFADHLIEQRNPNPETVVRDLSKALSSACRLTPSERHQVLMGVVPILYAFVEDICSTCKVNCLASPAKSFGNVFFQPEHPATLEEYPSSDMASD
jgi:hypothetical protein